MNPAGCGRAVPGYPRLAARIRGKPPRFNISGFMFQRRSRSIMNPETCIRGMDRAASWIVWNGFASQPAEPTAGLDTRMPAPSGE
jgi:hypothetical protein